MALITFFIVGKTLFPIGNLQGDSPLCEFLSYILRLFCMQCGKNYVHKEGYVARGYKIWRGSGDPEEKLRECSE